MSEKDKIKQFEEEQLDKLLVELKDIDNFKGFENGSFKYSLGKYQADLLLEHIDNLQQEHNILIEFEKWLEEDFTNEVEHPTPQIYCNCYSCKIKALDKLQELKEGKK